MISIFSLYTTAPPLRISERFRRAKDNLAQGTHHGSDEVPLPPPKKFCLDRARNALTHTAAQIRTGHWRSAVYHKRIRKRRDDRCWFRNGPTRMSCSHVLLHCPNARLSATRVRGLGRKKSRRRSRPPSQSSVGKDVSQVPGAIRRR